MALSRHPQTVSEHNWYYEEARGIRVVHEVHDSKGEYLQTDQFRIPWWQLRKSLGRKDAAK